MPTWMGFKVFTMFSKNLNLWLVCWVFIISCSWDAGLSSPLPIKQHEVFNLNSWIKHYDVATYDPAFLVHQHKRVRRAAVRKEIKLQVTAHDRIFQLSLFPDKTIFADDVVIESTSRGSIKFKKDILYTGKLEDDDYSLVYGIITKDGLFEGTILTRTDEFYIEPVSRYMNIHLHKEPTFHSIIYSVADVKDPTEGISCASNILFQKNNKMQRERRWVLQADSKLPYYDDLMSFNRTIRPFDLNFHANQQPIDEIMESENRTNVDTSTLMFKNIFKRTTVDPKKTTCMLYLQADHMFFQKYGTEEACIEVMTRHIQRVNTIYRNTDFNQDGRKDNITFMVQRIKIHTLEALKDSAYRFPNNYGVEKFLELFSEEDFDAFCLAYMFTYRDFEMGTLGLAWTGDLKNAGGVCEKNGHYRGSLKSLNTGIVTLLNYGKHVPPAVSHVTLAHEIGHNFGSPHDPEQCTPGGEDGNFIMFARATSGDKKNNNKFSTCSLKSINPVLNYKARSLKGCFTEPKGAICGNGVVEDGEECDCGWEEECRDQCCFPMRRFAPNDEPPCSLTPRSACSPSQGPCCTTDCQVKFGDKCRDDNGCRDESFCNGKDPRCPPSTNKPNKTICNQEFVCFMGECTGSICLAYGLESCQCIPKNGESITKACELCCKLPGDNQYCKSSFEWNDIPYDVPDMFAKPGTPCNDYSGYCDVFQMCREVDPSGPLATLRKLLLSDESIASFRNWIMHYWYAVAAILIAIISLLVLSTKYLGKRPAIKLKSITVMHKQTTDAAVHLPEGQGGIIIHQGVRSKVPLKKRVRNGRIKKKRKAGMSKDKHSKIESRLSSIHAVAAGNKITENVQEGITTDQEKNIIEDSMVTVVNSNKKKRCPKKKKILSLIVDEEETDLKKNVLEVSHRKAKKHPSKLRNKKKSEIIDYSSIQPDINGANENITTSVAHAIVTSESTDPVGKVHHWLKNQYCLPKSTSTPVGLTSFKATKLTRSTRLNKNQSKSIANIPKEKEKLRVQVVYKPPFKFSFKLRKPDKINVVAEKLKKSASRPAILVQSNITKPPDRGEKFSGKSTDVNNVEPALRDIDFTTVDIDSNVHTVQSDLEVLLSEENDYVDINE